MGISILQYLIEFGDKCISEDGEMLLLEGVLDGMNRLIEALATALNQASIMTISAEIRGVLGEKGRRGGGRRQ